MGVQGLLVIPISDQERISPYNIKQISDGNKNISIREFLVYSYQILQSKHVDSEKTKNDCVSWIILAEIWNDLSSTYSRK